MKIRSAADSDQQRWDSFVFAQEQASFLQSWQWGEIQREMGVSLWRLVGENEASLELAVLVLKRPLPFGRCWLYIPRGPIVSDGLFSDEVWQAFQNKVEELALAEGAIFVRCDPAVGDTWQRVLTRRKWQASERQVQPQHTLVLDLTLPQEELLADMHPKTRYNIRLAERKNVIVRFSSDEKDLEAFLELSQGITERTGFHYHPPEYYRAMVRVLGASGMLEIGVAEHQGEALAAHLIVSAGEVATYTHGASAPRKRQVMAPYLLHWEAIARAQARGLKKFDLFGVAPKSAGPDHPWAGITRFKLGFGGKRQDYIGAYDLVLEPGMYAAFNFARRVRGVLR